MITTVRMDDYEYLIVQRHLRLLGEREVCETAREDRQQRHYYVHEDYKHMMVVIQAPGGLIGLINQPVICKTEMFGDNPAWVFGAFPGAPREWRDGYVKVSIFRALHSEDLSKAQGTLITTLDAVWQKALGPTTVLLRQYGLIPSLLEEPDLAPRAASWWMILKRTLRIGKEKP